MTSPTTGSYGRPQGSPGSPIWVWVAGAVLAAVAAYGITGMLAAQGELETVKAERLDALKRAEDAGTARDALRQELEKLTAAQAEAESQRQKIEADVKAAATRMAEMQKSVDVLQGDLSFAREDAKAKEAQLTEARQQADAANAALALSEANIASTKKDADSLRTQLDEANRNLGALQGEAERLRGAPAGQPAPQAGSPPPAPPTP